MNSLIEGHDRQLSTMLEEILVTGDPGLSASADGDRAGGDGRLHRADSLSDESSYLLDQDNDFSSPIERKRKPIRGSTTYPNGVAFTTGSLGLSSAAGVAPLTGRSTLPSGAGHQPGDDSGELADESYFLQPVCSEEHYKKILGAAATMTRASLGSSPMRLPPLPPPVRVPPRKRGVHASPQTTPPAAMFTSVAVPHHDVPASAFAMHDHGNIQLHSPFMPSSSGTPASTTSAREELGNQATHQREVRGSALHGRPPSVPPSLTQKVTMLPLAEIPSNLGLGGLPSAHTTSDDLEVTHGIAQSLPANANIMQRRRVSWKVPHRLPETATPVVEHHLAGDLHLGTMTSASQRPPLHPLPTRNTTVGENKASPKNARHAFRQGGIKDRHASGVTLGAEGKPSRGFFGFHRDRDKTGGEEKQAPSIANSDMQFEADTDADQTPGPLYRKRWFWMRLMPGILTALFIMIGIVMVVRYTTVKAVYFEVWRWAFFFAGFTPIYWASRIMVHGLVVAVEYAFFTTKAIYYTYGVRRPLARFVRVVLVLPLFTGCFSGRENDSGSVHHAYVTIARILGCISLFFFANVLKALAAKLMATSFHQETHFKKMQEALQKEYWLMALSQPRSETKIDDAAQASILRNATQDDLGSDGLPDGSEDGDPHDKPDEKEPLSMWRAGSVPPEFQGRSTSSFINRLTTRIAKANRRFGKQQQQQNQPEQDLAEQQSPSKDDGRLSDVEEVREEPLDEAAFRSSLDDRDTPPGPRSSVTSVPGGQFSPRWWDRTKGDLDPCASKRSLRTLEHSTSRTSFLGHQPSFRPSVDSNPPSRTVSFNIPGAMPVPSNTLHGAGKQSFASNYTREPSIKSKGSIPHRQSLKSRRGGGSVAAPKTPSGASTRLRRQRTLFRTTGFKVGDGSEQARDLETVQEMAKVNPGRKQADMNGEVVAKLHLVEKHIRKNKLQVTFADQLGAAKHSEGEVGSKNEAKKLAFYLFWNIKPYFDRNYVLPEDLEYFLPAAKAAQAFELLDVDADGKVTLHDIRDAVINIYKERKHLAFQLKDTKTVVSKLERIFAVVIHLLFVILYLVIFDVDVNKVWITFSSIILAFSFVFSKSIGDMYAAVIFLFVVHPFDVGDALMIGSNLTGSALNQLVWVEEIALVSCVLRRWDGARLWWPNNLLGNNPLINLSRSNNKWEDCEVYVDASTPAEVWDVLRKAVEEFTAEHPENFSGQCAVFCFGAGDPLKMLLGVYFEYSFNGVDQGRLNVARHGLYMCIRQVLNEQNVVYSMPTFRSGGSVSTPPGLGRNGDAAGSSHAPPPGATPPSVPVQHAVSRASQAGWLPGQRGDDQIEGLRALVPGTIREQLT